MQTSGAWPGGALAAGRSAPGEAASSSQPGARRTSPGPQRALTLPAAVQEGHVSRPRDLRDFEESVDVKLSRVYEMIKVVSESSEARLQTLEHRLEAGLSDLDIRLEDLRAEQRSKGHPGQAAPQSHANEPTSEEMALIRTQTAALVEALRTQHGGHLESLRAQVSDLRSVVEAGASRKAIQELRARQAQFDLEMDTLRSQSSCAATGQSQILDQFEAVRAQFVDSIRALQRQHSEQSGELESLRGEGGLAGGRLEAAVAEQGRSLRRELEAHRADAESLRVRGGEVAEGLEECRGALAALQGDAAGWQRALAGLEAEHADLRGAVSRQRDELAGEVAEERALRGGASRAQAGLAEELEALREVRRQDRGGWEAAQARHALALEASRSQQGHLAEAQGQLQSDVASLKRQLVEATRALHALRGQDEEREEALELARGHAERHGRLVEAVEEAHAERHGRLEARVEGAQRAHAEDANVLQQGLDRAAGALESLQTQLHSLSDVVHGSHSRSLEALQDEGPLRWQETHSLLEQHKRDLEEERRVLEAAVEARLHLGGFLARCGMGL